MAYWVDNECYNCMFKSGSINLYTEPTAEPAAHRDTAASTSIDWSTSAANYASQYSKPGGAIHKIRKSRKIVLPLNAASANNSRYKMSFTGYCMAYLTSKGKAKWRQMPTHISAWNHSAILREFCENVHSSLEKSIFSQFLCWHTQPKWLSWTKSKVCICCHGNWPIMHQGWCMS